MSDFTIDPTQLLSVQAQDPTLIKLLSDLLQQSAPSYLPHGEYSLILNDKTVTVELTHSLLKRSRENKTDEYRIEVFEHQKCSDGGFSELFKSLGVLIPEQNYLFRSKPIDKSRVCKIIPITEEFTAPMINREGSYTKMNKLLHCKTPVFDDTHGYLVMRNAGKSDLHELLNDLFAGDLVLSLLQKLQLTYTILKAIKEQIHDLGLIHADIKPENIMIDLDTMSVKIIDYAFAHEISLPREATSTVGSIEYSAPEALYKATMTTKSDAFSAGITIAELWGDTSTYPIQPNFSFQDVYEFHKTRVWNRLFEFDSLSERMKNRIIQILDNLTHLNPDHRCTTEEALNEWEVLLDEYISRGDRPDAPSRPTSGSLFFQNRPDSNDNESYANSKRSQSIQYSEIFSLEWRRNSF